MDQPRPAQHASTSPREVAHLRRRVRLYLLIMLGVDLVAYISDYISPLLIEGLVWPEYDLVTRIVRHGSTVVMAAALAVTHLAPPRRSMLITLESVATISLVLIYIRVGLGAMTGEVAPFAPVFSLFGITLILSVRAALVPSHAARTLSLGAVSIACFFALGWPAIAPLEPQIRDGLNFIAGAFLVATAVTSHVIYGLRREVRKAQQLGQYTLEEKLGEGGMGAVYRARHAMLRRLAAIKLIRTDLAGDRAGKRHDARQRFEREADVTSNLRSPHTIELYDFGLSDTGDFYYVMELLDGINLDVAVRKYGPMPPERVVYLLRQVCDSLEEAHTAGLVHRDIKPANIFLCRYGLRFDFVKVLDFGLVALGPQFEGDDQHLTAEGVAAGTPAFIAPEMVSNASPVDGRTDLYALGCVAYWLLTAHAPFERETAMATIVAHVNDEPIPASRVTEAEIPEALDSLILECLAKDPADRPPSAAVLAQWLAALADPIANSASEPGGLEPEDTRDRNGRGWSQDLAKQWWTQHKPETSKAPADKGGPTQTVTRAHL